MNIFPYHWHHFEEYGCTKIRIFGLSEINESIYIQIDDFLPYIYIELPQLVWSSTAYHIVQTKLKEISNQNIIKMEPQQKKKLYFAKKIIKDGELVDQTYSFIKCYFKTSINIRNFVYKLKSPIFFSGIGKLQLKCHEMEANPILQFMCISSLKPASWFTFRGKKITKEEQETLCDHEYHVGFNNVLAIDNQGKVPARPLILSFDIEVNSNNPNVFPQSSQPEDKVFQISCVFGRNGDSEEKYDKYILTLCKNKKGEIVDLNMDKLGEGIEVLGYETEGDLLEGFKDLIIEKNPQIICGYNIFSFDITYMYERSKICNIERQFTQLSYIRGISCKMKEIKWSSSAFKNQEFNYLDAHGRLWIDLLPIIQRDYKLENYKLKTVSDQFISSTKDPLTPKGIFKCYRMFTPDSLAIVGKYCVQDSLLVLKLFEKLQIWIGLCEMSNTCNTPIFTLFTQGQQIKIFSQVYKKCMDENFVIDKDSFITKETDRFTGAYVFPPVPGLYDMVVSFDFSSLYPSTMIAFNIDYSTLVLDEKIPDEKCHIVEWTEHQLCSHDQTIRKTKPKEIICEHHRYRFLKEPLGVIPTLLKNLLDARKKTNADMKNLIKEVDEMKDKSTIEYEDKKRMITVYDKRQLSYKISCNSVSSNTPIPCIDKDKKFMYLTMEEISDGSWITDSENNQVSKPKKELSVWTEKGYTKINYVIRHPIRTPLKRVLTHTGCVDVTEEHSLLDENANKVRTIDLSIGDKLLHYSLPLPKDTPNNPMFDTISKETIELFDLKGNISYEKAFVWGLFFAEGTSGNWGVLEKAKSSWIIYNLDKDLLTRAKSMIEKVEDMTFIISGLYKNQGSGIYHLKPNNNKEGSIVSLSKKYRSLFYDQRGYKRIPAEIFQSDFYTRQSFLMGYYAGDGARLLKKGVVIHNKGEIGTAGLYYLAKSLGYIVSISYSSEQNSIYRLQCCTTFRHKNTTSIKSILPATPVPEIKKLQPDIIRNNTKIFFNEEEIVIYRGVRINCQRIPRQKLLDAIDHLINIMKKRHCSILEYYTDSKKIKYQTWCCNKQCLIGIKCVYLDTITYARICDCDKSTIVDDEYNNKEDEKEDEKIDYIYDIETENHHFAAGVGDLIVHNSMYGGYGVKKGYLPFMTGAMCVTAKGRQSIEKASKFLVENYGAKLIYGDSISGDTPILIRYEDQSIDIIRIDEIGEVWKPYEEFKKEDSNRKEKEQTLPFISNGHFRLLNILEVWTGEWSRIKRVIRHKTVKKMYRVLTNSGCVDVTEDHSLLDKNKNKIKPSELNIGTELYHSFPPREDFLEIEIKDAIIEGKVFECIICNQYKLYFEFDKTKVCKECRGNLSETEYCRNPAKNLCNNLAYVWGIFFVKGNCSNNIWEINSDINTISKCKDILEECEPLFRWEINDFKLKLIYQDNMSFIINKWRRLFYDRDGYKKVPYFILNANDNMKIEFMNGCGYQSKFDIKGKIGSQGIYTLLLSLGFNVSINVNKNIYTLHICNLEENYSVKEIIDLPDSSSYVYDIETEAGIFMGGVGQIILKNTDSCYINFPEFGDKTKSKELDAFCRQVEDEVSSVFPKPMKFAYEEQIYWRYLILTKKRYMALKCDLDGNIDNKIAKRGVLLSRRDNSKFIRDTYSNLILKSFYKEDIDNVLYELYKDVKKICIHHINIKDLVVTKSIGAICDYKIRPLHIDDKKCKKRLEELGIYDSNANLDVIRSIITAFGKKEDVENEISLEYLIFKEYVKISLPAQIQLAERMRKRGCHVSAGERLSYVITQNGEKLSEKMEDVEYFKEHSETLRIDSLYYMKLMINPFDEVLMTV
jgi:DNA polymerase elongation subunit (family B)